MHVYLVAAAIEWLRCQGCVYVLAERGASRSERPDAIGWQRNGNSILIEAKRSRKDFLDEWRRRKRFRTASELGMGTSRLYISPPGVIRPLDLDGPVSGWGLLYVHLGGVTTTLVDSLPFQANQQEELKLILSSLRNKVRPRSPQLVFDFSKNDTEIGQKREENARKRPKSARNSQNLEFELLAGVSRPNR